MNEKEIERQRRNCVFCSKNWWKLRLREIVNSVWCYNNYKDIESYMNDRYILNYQEHDLSLEEIEEIVISQVNYLNENCRIERNVYQDNEGVVYNSIVDINEV